MYNKGLISIVVQVNKILLLSILFFMMSGCMSTSNQFAPVTDGWTNTGAASQTYRVQPDDTLYLIAFRYGLDYRQIATENNLLAPYDLTTGQTLILTSGSAGAALPTAADTSSFSDAPVSIGAAPATTVSSQPVESTPLVSAPVATVSGVSETHQPVVSAAPSKQPLAPLPTGPVGKWLWPTQGKVIHPFSEAYGGNKGLDIAGTEGQPIQATAAGRVVYSGTGLRGYGLLIIIRHSGEFLSAYAHNQKALVKEGDVVKAGQEIAHMGDADASQVMLHFEIRRAGKPVDPLIYLPAHS